MIILVGTNHKRSPVEVRERLAFSRNSLRQTIFQLLETEVIRAPVILSTCNRVEIYADVPDAEKGIFGLKNLLLQHYRKNSKRPEFSLDRWLYSLVGKAAIRHLFEVAAGLDSQVLGETQILEQLAFAHRESVSVWTDNSFIDRVFTAAAAAGKKVRRETGIAQGKVSIGSVAFDFIQEKTGGLSGKNILIIGVGKVSELVTKYLGAAGPTVTLVANRTYQKAKELAEKIGGRAVGFTELKKKLKTADIVISATASPHLIIRKEDLSNLEKPLLILDLAVPRDVEPTAREIPGIDLFDLDDLQLIIDSNLGKRRSAAESAGRILEREAARLWEKLSVPEEIRVPLPESIWWEPVRATQI